MKPMKSLRRRIAMLSWKSSPSAGWSPSLDSFATRPMNGNTLTDSTTLHWWKW